MMRKALSALLMAAVFAGGYAAHRPTTVTRTVVHTVDDVTSFNDGWNTALYGDGKR